jgi:hypothetical protein
MKLSFQWGVHCEFHVQNYKRAILSVPALIGNTELDEKDLLARGTAMAQGKATLAEHLSLLYDQDIIPSDAPLLVLGIRNNLVNLRAPILWRGRSYAVEGECPEDSLRPYYGLGNRDGRIILGRALGGSLESWPDFFVAGIPVLWDDADDETLQRLILAEAGDHSHVFNLPRGNHPNATDAMRSAWSQLHEAFRASVHADLSTAASAMRSVVAAINPPPLRCENYLNAVVGIRHDGDLVCIYAHGRLETLGRRAKALGCQRAVCVENSGSVMPTYLPNGLLGEQIPLLRAPNFRPHGRGVLVLELNNKVFESFPVFGNESF